MVCIERFGSRREGLFMAFCIAENRYQIQEELSSCDCAIPEDLTLGTQTFESAKADRSSSVCRGLRMDHCKNA